MRTGHAQPGHVLELARGQALPRIGAELELADRLRRAEAAALVRFQPHRLRLHARQGAVADAQQDAEYQARVGRRLAQGCLWIGTERIEPWLPGAEVGTRCGGGSRVVGLGAGAEHLQRDRRDVLAFALERAGALGVELGLAAVQADQDCGRVGFRLAPLDRPEQGAGIVRALVPDLAHAPATHIVGALGEGVLIEHRVGAARKQLAEKRLFHAAQVDRSAKANRQSCLHAPGSSSAAARAAVRAAMESGRHRRAGSISRKTSSTRRSRRARRRVRRTARNPPRGGHA